ncbi:MAG: HIT domain-containing protein [bacterium]
MLEWVFISGYLCVGQDYAFTIGINHGRMSGQMVDHLHIHVLPRFKDDGGKSIHSVVNNKPHESIKAMREKIIQK